jgi:hypothetical protein
MVAKSPRPCRGPLQHHRLALRTSHGRLVSGHLTSAWSVAKASSRALFGFIKSNLDILIQTYEKTRLFSPFCLSSVHILAQIPELLVGKKNPTRGYYVRLLFIHT